jgi:radical SAM superfamily enzyme YgiQ (UPF0313 family)
MRYEGKMYRPPSEAHSYILQATVGCSWNACTYCDMYRDKAFRVRNLADTLADIRAAGASFGQQVTKVFVADGDALVMDMDHWRAILNACAESFPHLRRVSAYATARNLNEKSASELQELHEQGLSLLYIGPESGDDITLKRIAKGANFEEHAVAAQKAHAAGMQLSAIFLLGAGGTERSDQHAEASGRLMTAMDPEFLSCLTLTVVPTTPIATLVQRGKFELPTVERMLGELRTMIACANPTHAVFRTNHASNYLPIAGELPRDRERLLGLLDTALSGQVQLRPEWARGL